MVINEDKNKLAADYSVILIVSLIMPFIMMSLLNIHLWNISFTPIDFILKPFVIIPVVYLFLILFISGTSYALNFVKRLSQKINRNDYTYRSSLNKGKKNWVAYLPVIYTITSITLSYGGFYLLHVHWWNLSFNPIDFILKPFLIIPFVYILTTLFVMWTSYGINFMKELNVKIRSKSDRVYTSQDQRRSKWEEYSTVIYSMTSIIISYSLFNLLNIYLWNLSFNPIDFIVKPSMIIPIMYLLLILFIKWARNAFHYVKKLSLTDEIGSLKQVGKRLSIHIIDQSYFIREDFQIKGTILVDMRIRNRDNLSFKDNIDVIKLYNNDTQVNIPFLIEKANLIIKNTALKNGPITFIVDSKKESSRTISKIWLRLIRNPKSRSAKSDIHTILELVY